MTEPLFKDIEAYCSRYSSAPDDVLRALDRETHLTTIAPQMSAGPYQGVLLEIVARTLQPQRILEIGTFTGYATICLARGLANGGTMDTIEVDPEREKLIRKYIEAAGLSNRVTIHIGDAMQVIPALTSTYQLIYVDAGKRDYARHFEMVLPLMEDNGLLIFDNVLWDGKVLDEEMDRDALAMHAFNRKLARDKRISAVILPVRDGMTLITKL